MAHAMEFESFGGFYGDGVTNEVGKGFGTRVASGADGLVFSMCHTILLLFFIGIKF